LSERNLHEDDIRRIVRDETAGREEAPASPIGDPAPLGLAAFALTTFLLSLFNAGLLNSAGEPVVFSLGLFYGGLAQFLAGMWEFRNNNTFGATAFTSYGAFWLAFWGLQQFYVDKIPEAVLGPAVGWFLIAWGIFTAYMWIGSFGVNTAVMLVFLLLATTFFVLGIGDLIGNDAIGVIGGYLGIVTAIVAWYTSAAGVINTTLGRAVLPVGTPRS
jgi:succinate-acetate transporter protein